MADLPIRHNYEVQPPDSVLRKWQEIRIQEKRSQIAAAKQRIQDLQRGEIINLEAKITMWELEIVEFEANKNSITVNEEK